MDVKMKLYLDAAYRGFRCACRFAAALCVFGFATFAWGMGAYNGVLACLFALWWIFTASDWKARL